MLLGMCKSLFILCATCWFGAYASWRRRSQQISAIAAVKEAAKHLDQSMNGANHLQGPSPASASFSSSISTAQPARLNSVPAQLPPSLRSFADRCFDLVTRHSQPDVNAYGLPWELRQRKEDRAIWSSQVPDQPT